MHYMNTPPQTSLQGALRAICNIDDFIQLVMQPRPETLAHLFANLDQGVLDQFLNYLHKTAVDEEPLDIDACPLANQVADFFKSKTQGRETPQTELLIDNVKWIAFGIDRLSKRLQMTASSAEMDGIPQGLGNIDLNDEKVKNEDPEYFVDKIRWITELPRSLEGDVANLTQNLDFAKMLKQLANKKIQASAEDRQAMKKLLADHDKEKAALVARMTAEHEKEKAEMAAQIADLQEQLKRTERDKSALVERAKKLKEKQGLLIQKVEEKRKIIREMKKEAKGESSGQKEEKPEEEGQQAEEAKEREKMAQEPQNLQTEEAKEPEKKAQKHLDQSQEVHKKLNLSQAELQDVYARAKTIKEEMLEAAEQKFVRKMIVPDRWTNEEPEMTEEQVAFAINRRLQALASMKGKKMPQAAVDPAPRD